MVADLFSRQCKPWKAISQELVELIHEAAAVTFNQIVSKICDENTRNRLMKGMIQPSLYKLRQQLRNKVEEFLEPHLSVHPISYNEDLVSFVQRTQAQRHKRKFDRVAEKACGCSTETVQKGSYEKINLKCLLDSLLQETEPDVREYSASLAADVAAAYYQVRYSRPPEGSPHSVWTDKNIADGTQKVRR